MIVVTLGIFVTMALVLFVTNYNYSVQAEPDCEQVGVHDNPSGNAAGNGQQCISDEHIKNEPVRDCSHKNSEKDNNENGITACVPRGPVDEDD